MLDISVLFEILIRNHVLEERTIPCDLNSRGILIPSCSLSQHQTRRFGYEKNQKNSFSTLADSYKLVEARQNYNCWQIDLGTAACGQTPNLRTISHLAL